VSFAIRDRACRNLFGGTGLPTFCALAAWTGIARTVLQEARPGYSMAGFECVSRKKGFDRRGNALHKVGHRYFIALTSTTAGP